MRWRVESLASLTGLRICCYYELCGVGHRQGLDPVLLWLWGRPSAVAPIGALAWAPPYVASVALKSKKKKKKRRRRRKTHINPLHAMAGQGKKKKRKVNFEGGKTLPLPP